MRCQKSEGLPVDRAKAETVEKMNLGYFAGYSSHETRERVEKLFRCAHPVFGKVSVHKPTTKEGLEAGINLGKNRK